MKSSYGNWYPMRQTLRWNSNISHKSVRQKLSMAILKLKLKLTKRQKKFTSLIKESGWLPMKSISTSTKLPFRVPKNFWSNIKTVQKTLGLLAILALGFTLPLWSPKKLKSLPSHSRMSQLHIGLVMDRQSLLWKNTTKPIGEQKSFCTSIRIRKSFWKNRKFDHCSPNTINLCPFRSNWVPKKSPKQRGRRRCQGNQRSRWWHHQQPFTCMD